jgi:RNA polymerase sigma-70 factor (ECF subfamily)
MGSVTRPLPAEEAVTFAELFERFAPYVLGLVRRLGVPDADVEDVAQEVFLAVHTQLPQFEGRSTHKTWLCGISLRVVANYRRKRARRRESASELEVAVDATQEQRLERADEAAKLQRALDALDDKLREVFVLYEIEELPMLEVARAVGCVRFTAYTRLRTARAQLKATLQREAAREAHRGVR